jgi:hypothetical protein
MSEEEIGEIQDALKEYKRQLDLVREDLSLLIRHSSMAQQDIIGYANQKGNQAYDQEEVERCRLFVEKYKFKVG